MSELSAVTVETSPPYVVHIGPNALAASGDTFNGAGALIADERVFDLFGDTPGLSELPRHLLPEGEAAKTLSELERAEEIRAKDGATFYLCRRAARDPRLEKYPRLPVHACPGYDRVEKSQP